VTARDHRALTRSVSNERPESRRRGELTQERLISATLRTLRDRGYRATTARAVAQVAGVAPGVIYYHYDSVEALLLASLHDISRRRLAAYARALANATTASNIVTALATLYEEDMESGHISAIQELVAGASSSTELGREIANQIEPWIDFAERAVQRFAAGTRFESIIPARDVAFSGVALYLGMETLTHLDGDRSSVLSLLAFGQRVAPIIDLMLGKRSDGEKSE